MPTNVLLDALAAADAAAEGPIPYDAIQHPSIRKSFVTSLDRYCG